MKDDRPDRSLPIGLHKLAEQNGDGMVPELHRLLAEERSHDEDEGNILRFASRSVKGSSGSSESPSGGRVLPFRR